MGIKDDILMAGSTLLREKGVTALTQPQVALAANIKQSHLTYYFPTRSSLLLAIAEYTLSGLMDEVAARLQASPRDKTLAEALSRIMIEGFPPRVFIGLIVAADSDPDIRKLLRKLIRRVRTALQHLLEQAGIAADAEAAMLFHASLVGLAVMHQARMSRESAADVRDGIARLMCMLAPQSLKRP
jgi:AcrR family transcriptional regulator